jgi:hypothetical protein
MAQVKKPKPVFPVKRQPTELPEDAPSWPLLRAYAPWRDCWNATGCGSAMVLRQAEDGRIALAVANAVLISGGMTVVLGGGFTTQTDVDAFLARMGDRLPPWEVATAEVAGDFAWGARALAESYGTKFDERIETFFRMFPPAQAATPADRVARLLGEGGLTPGNLAEIVKRNYKPDLPVDGREPRVQTAMTFRVGNSKRTSSAIEDAAPEFAKKGKEFVWTRESPKEHRSAMARAGRRQVLGSIRIEEGGILRAQAETLTMSAVLANKIRRLASQDLRLEKVDWTNPTASEKNEKP